MRAVQVAVFQSAKYYADQRPDFYWVLFDLALRDCIVSEHEIPDIHSLSWDEWEANKKLALLEHADTHLASATAPELPTIPLPWIKGDGATTWGRRDTKGYKRNDQLFLYDLASKILPQACLEPILSSDDHRTQFLRLITELLEWTIQEIVPPFVERRRQYKGNTPFEWIFDFSSWCGRISAQLTSAEVEKVMLARIFACDLETELLIMQSLMKSYMIKALLSPKTISDESLAIWQSMAERIFVSPEWSANGSRNNLDRHYITCAFSILFCVAPDFSPLICGLDPGWPPLGKFLAIIERAIRQFGVNATLYLGVTTLLKRGGIDLLPDPALAWLEEIVQAKKQDSAFWQSNGEDTVDLLKHLIETKGTNLTQDHKRVIALIADMLVDNGVRGAGFLQQELLRTS